ncbi:MAG TPA: hypothetical protein VKW08_00490 [Xanthobacteraceae bacterium]|jgi:hypothetical protein|nr:hypothetical protein [Xanthobacteraceae bacterium]
MPDQDDLFGDDPMEDAALEAYERDRDGLQDQITEYLEDFEVNPGVAVIMLLEIMISLRLEAYGFGVENPSVAGLKLDLDRLGHEVAEALRETKKKAELLLEEIKQARADAEAEEEAEEREGSEDEDEEDEQAEDEDEDGGEGSEKSPG